MRDAGQELGLIRRHLEPADRLNEMLFGLIMALTFTLTAEFAVGDEANAARQLLLATIGCNIAWGIIDGAMYLMGQLLERSRRQRSLLVVQQAPDEATAIALVETALPSALVEIATREERERLSGLINALARRVKPARTRIRRDDVLGAIASGLLVIMVTIPAAIPFLLFSDHRVALRVSNALLVGLLFVVGHQWGKFSYTSRMGAGLAFVAMGLTLVGIAIALGG